MSGLPDGSAKKGFVAGLLANPALPSILAVCVCSISMTVMNKYIVSGSQFSMNFLLLSVQAIVCSAVVSVAKRMGLIDFRPFDWGEAYRWSPISLGLVTVMYTGSKSLQYLSIPVYTIFKNLTIILIAYGEVLWFGGVVTRPELTAFFLMVCSSLIAASSNISAFFAHSATLPELTGSRVSNDTNVGYLWVLVNCLASAGYILTMRVRIKATGFKDWDTMAYNNIISIPILLFMSIVTEGWTADNFSKNFPAESRTFLISAMIFSGGIAVFISYATAWCIRVTSSTTYSMVGALNKLPVAVSGMLFFADPVTLKSVSAITLGFLAGLLYTDAKAKINEQKRKQAEASGQLELERRLLAEEDEGLKSSSNGGRRDR